MNPRDPRDPWPFLEGSPEFAAAMRQAASEPFKPFVHRVGKPTPEDMAQARKSPWYLGYLYGVERARCISHRALLLRVVLLAFGAGLLAGVVVGRGL